MKGWLLAAAAYNLVFGAWAVVFPSALFTWAGMEAPNYPELWQCIGMIVGVYGIGYAIAAFDPYRHWPIVLVGFLGKIFGPIGFAQALWQGSLPLKFGAILLSNDLVWWIPFALILWGAYQEGMRGRRESACPEVVEAT
ncbi:alkyl hydroperoxide reductase [Tautonia marina]|uniref:alkyl hydroperoxide reductase n=1 Tax=Tautonia marina TaxID=2653855 RepID=UPI001260A26C|nr:alkyl hydroperoxide reductase [Tautonia marina]